jgi:hypothetical protein
VKPTASNVPQDASKATKAPNRLINGHENTEKPTEEILAKPEASTAPAQTETPKPANQEASSSEPASSASKDCFHNRTACDFPTRK